MLEILQREMHCGAENRRSLSIVRMNSHASRQYFVCEAIIMRIQARKRRLYAVTAVYDILCKSYDYVMLLDCA